MVSIPLGLNDWQTKFADISIRIRLRNMYLMSNPFSPDGVTRVTRPSLTKFQEISNLPIYGMWRQDGSIDGDWFIVAGEQLYRFSPPNVLTFVGNIPGTEYCQFAGTDDRVLISRNGVAYSTDGVGLTTIVMPDNVPAGPLAMLDSVFFIGVKGSQRFYWINPGEINPDPLSFASAERTPDALLAIQVINDEIWLIGASSVEVWQSTGDITTPYVRISGRVYTEGCAEAATCVTSSYEGQPCLFWVTDKRAVILAQGSPTKISNESVEEILRGSANYRAWGFRLNRHDFYILSCDDATFAYDVAQRTWCRWDTYLKNNWRAHLGLQVDDVIYAGDSEQGIIWQLQTEGESDEDLPIIREVSGFLPEQSVGQDCFSVNARINAGWSPDYTHDPVLELRWSDDYGYSYTEYFPCKIGNKGNYAYDVVWRSLGQISRPGREFEFRFSEKAKFRIDFATMNEV